MKRPNYLRAIYLRLAGVVMLVVSLALAATSYFSHRSFERALAPELAKKIATVGASTRALVLKAVDQQIDIHDLYGIEQKFDEVKNDTPEISYFAITDPQGQVLHQRLKGPAGAAEYFRSAAVLELLAQPWRAPPSVRVGNIVNAQGPLGMLHMGVDVRFFDDIVLGMLYDVLVVLVVSLFLTLELLNFMAGAKLESALKSLGDLFERGASGNFSSPRTTPEATDASAFAGVTALLQASLARVNAGFATLAQDIDSGRRVPAHERRPGLAAAQTGLQALAQRFRFGADSEDKAVDDRQLGKVRAPLFLFILAEELTRSFLPTYVKELLVPLPWLSPQIIMGLPIALFMLIVALGQPWLGVYCERVGQRRTMLIGACIATVGFAASALAHNVLDLMLWRSLCAVGYAMVFVSGQAYVLAHSNPGNKAKGFAMFVGTIMVATVCGPSIGGILADNVGVRPTLGLAAVLALSSIAVIRLLPAHNQAAVQTRAAASVPHLQEIFSLMLNRRFMTVTGLAAMPAKILLTGVCFYLVPLYMLSIGSTQAMAGRILMSYAVMMVLMAPLTANWATSRQRMEWLIGGGLLLSGAGGLLLLAGGGVGWVFAAVMMIGVGQSLSISAQSALVGDHCRAEVARIGEGAVYGVYRLLERMGNAAGPLIAALLVMSFGYRTSFVAIGGGVLLCGAAFLLATRRQRSPVLLAA
jgi:MFS family permease/HAMP domain-containing protein